MGGMCMHHGRACSTDSPYGCMPYTQSAFLMAGCLRGIIEYLDMGIENLGCPLCNAWEEICRIQAAQTVSV